LATKSNGTVLSRIHPAVLQQAYSLRDQVLLALGEGQRPGQKVVLTSCHRGEGVTTVAVSLAVALGLADKWPVLLCDTNVHRPGLRRFVAQETGPGLVDVMAGECELGKAVQATVIPTLKILTAGSRRMHPSELIESPYQDVPFRDLLPGLEHEYRFIIFDAPPVLDHSATSLLGAMADGTILVIEAERERYEVAQLAVRLLRSAGARLLGAVLNKRQFHIPGFLYRRL